MTKSVTKTMPNSPEAEMCLLGSMILDWRVIDDVIGIVPSGECFYSQAHAAIFDAACRCGSKDALDLALLGETLGAKLADVGGTDYLLRLIHGTPSSVNAVHYARIVRSRWLLRRVIEASGDVLHRAYNAESADDAAAVLETAQSAIMGIADSEAATSGTEPMPMSTLMQALERQLEAGDAGSNGISTGYYDWDAMTGGIHTGEMTVIGARPSMGKTSLAMGLAVNLARHVPVGIVSLEMSQEELARRMACAEAGADLFNLRRNMLSGAECKNLARASKELGELPMFIAAPGMMTLTQLRAQCRRWKMRYGVRAIVVDYLQLLSEPTYARERLQEVSAASRTLKQIARDCGVAVIALAQLSRAVESREDRVPRLSDLRESGTIEQDADNVLMLHRPEYYGANDPDWALSSEGQEWKGKAGIFVAKQRNGKVGEFRLAWVPQSTAFKNLASEYRRDAPTANVTELYGGDDLAF